MEKKVKVIYIVGEGRSGSTLFERILGQHPQIFAAGELKHIWKRSFIENQLCSCGRPFYDCLYWREIVNIFFEKHGRVLPQKVIEAFEKTSRLRHYMLGKNLTNRYSNFINKVYLDLYDSIKEYTNKKFIIDASKHPVFAHILARNSNLDLYFIHIIRDVHGVAYSWKKKKVRPEIVDKEEYMPQYSIIRTALSWNVVNKIALDLKKLKNIKYMQIYYEEFIRRPQETLKEVCKFLEIENVFDKLFISEDELYLFQNHTVAGNPLRFKTGYIRLNLDEEWKKKLNRGTKYLITFLSYPYLKKFGYLKSVIKKK